MMNSPFQKMMTKQKTTINGVVDQMSMPLSPTSHSSSTHASDSTCSTASTSDSATTSSSSSSFSSSSSSLLLKTVNQLEYEIKKSTDVQECQEVLVALQNLTINMEKKITYLQEKKAALKVLGRTHRATRNEKLGKSYLRSKKGPIVTTIMTSTTSKSSRSSSIVRSKSRNEATEHHQNRREFLELPCDVD